MPKNIPETIPEPSRDVRETLVIGTNHQSSSMGVRDRLFIEDADVPGVQERLQARGVLQALVLSTCDRIEVHVVHQAGDDTASRIIEVLAEHAGMAVAELANQLYVLSGTEAVHHIFRVAASLNSLIIGEPQVLGQVKAAHRLSRTCGAIGADLESLLQSAYEVAKRVRTDTGIGAGPVSIAAAMVQLARDLHGDLSQCNTLVVGAGDMGALIATSLREAGLQQLTLMHPSAARVENLARALNSHVAPYEKLADHLIDADIVLMAMGRRHYILNADLVNGAIAHRRHKPVLLIDTSVPGDIEPAVSRIDDAFVYDFNDLERLAVAGRAKREAEAEKAAALVEAGVEDYLRTCAERTASPILTLLRQHFETERRKALIDAGQDAEKATRLFMNRLLHAPSERLRKIAADQSASAQRSQNPQNSLGPSGPSGWLSLEIAIKRLFALDGQRLKPSNVNEKHDEENK